MLAKSHPAGKYLLIFNNKSTRTKTIEINLVLLLLTWNEFLQTRFTIKAILEIGDQTKYVQNM